MHCFNWTLAICGYVMLYTGWEREWVKSPAGCWYMAAAWLSLNWLQRGHGWLQVKISLLGNWESHFRTISKRCEHTIRRIILMVIKESGSNVHRRLYVCMYVCMHACMYPPYGWKFGGVGQLLPWLHEWTWKTPLSPCRRFISGSQGYFSF